MVAAMGGSPAWGRSGAEQAAVDGGVGSAAPLPLGASDLPEQSTTEVLAPGLTHYRIERGRPNAAAWTLEANVALTAADAEHHTKCFTALNLRSQPTEFAIPFGDGVTYRVIQGGDFRTREEARNVMRSLLACPLHLAHTAEEVRNELGPWIVNILAIDPKLFTGRLSPILARAGDLKGGELTSKMAQASDALAAINGGFFVEHERDGYPGEPAGISVIAGQIMSEPVAQRPALVFTQAQDRPVHIADWSDWSMVLAWDDGKTTELDGINRKPGLVRNCGERGARPTERPVHDFTCTRGDEIIYFTPGRKFDLHGISGTRFVLLQDGDIRALDPAEPIPAESGLLIATGKRIKHLSTRLSDRRRARLVTSSAFLGDATGGISVVNAGPTLIRGGKAVRNDADEGWSIDILADSDHRNLIHNWINRRHPRTAAGIRADGVILFVTVDGHRPDTSVGLSIEELRRLMAHLRAHDAVNLDGGGSTTMVINDAVVNAPTDATGERPVGDAILVLPK